ncbi:ribokinase [Pseudonocardia spinosispora]|uniref:ribokinase n=1 Tax=Pseudonocardia spinosispora TaxID=103441 RepID=UPI00040EC18F|nr:ribokinase [Pseudonocardia spinosispora]
MPEAGSVLVVGSLNIDHVVVADKFPSPGETILGNSTHVGLGGKGSNQAVASALAGTPTTIIARVGSDPEGVRAREVLTGRGVDVSRVTVVEGEATGTAWITVAEQDNTIIVVSAANHSWPSGADPLGDARATVLLCQLEIPFDVVERAASTFDGLFVLNAAPAAQLADSLIARCDVLIVNEHEQAVVAGLPADTPVEEAHAELRRRGARAVVTTLGKAGAVITDSSGETTTIPAIPARTVVDTTGAGDAFAGVLAARLAVGDSLTDAARWGAAAGSLAVRSPGAQESYATYETLTSTVHPT